MDGQVHYKALELGAAAVALASQEKYTDAIKQFSEAISVHPTDYRFYFNRSYCFYKVNAFAASLNDAIKAIELNAFGPKSYYRKGLALRQLKRYPEAEEAYRRVLELDPNCKETPVELYGLRYCALRDGGQSEETAVYFANKCKNLDQCYELLKYNNGGDSGSCKKSDGDATSMMKMFASTNVGRRFRGDGDYPGESYCPVDIETLKRKIPIIFESDMLAKPTNLLESHCLFVDNLLPTCTDKKIGNLFARFGKVVNVKTRKPQDVIQAIIVFDNPRGPVEAITKLRSVVLDEFSNDKLRPLQFRFYPSDEQKKNLTKEEACKRISDANECFYWRIKNGCNLRCACNLKHYRINRGIDTYVWSSEVRRELSDPMSNIRHDEE